MPDQPPFDPDDEYIVGCWARFGCLHHRVPMSVLSLTIPRPGWLAIRMLVAGAFYLSQRISSTGRKAV